LRYATKDGKIEIKGDKIMPTLHVRNVPDDLYEHIRQQAQRTNRSISAQVITLLSRAVVGGSQQELLEQICRRRFFNPRTSKAPDSTALLREDRAR
jgi:plasmid stability protein